MSGIQISSLDVHQNLAILSRSWNYRHGVRILQRLQLSLHEVILDKDIILLVKIVALLLLLESKGRETIDELLAVLILRHLRV